MRGKAWESANKRNGPYIKLMIKLCNDKYNSGIVVTVWQIFFGICIRLLRFHGLHRIKYNKMITLRFYH